MPLARRILLYLFASIYLILCPLVILYSFGFIFSPTRNTISQTGLIHLSTLPAEAEVFLQRMKYKFKTPVTLSELLPGNYKITVKLKGYRPWEHTVSVEEGKAAVFADIILIPSIIKPRKISEKFFTGLIPLPSSGYLLLTSGHELGIFFSLDLNKEKLERLAFLGSKEAELSVVSYFSQNNSKSIIIHCGSFLNRKYLFKNFSVKEEGFLDITKLISGKPDTIAWSHQNENNLFAVYNDYVDRINVDTMALFPKYLENIRGFGVSGAHLYVLNEDNMVVRMNYDKAAPQIITRDFFSNAQLSESNFYRIHELQKDILLFWGNKGQLFLTSPSVSYVLADRDIEGVQYNDQAKRLVFWSRKKIWLADLEASDSSSAEKSLKLSQISDNGQDLKQCVWVDASHLLCRDRDIVFLIQLQSDGKHNVEQLIKVMDNTDIYFSSENGLLYFLDKKSGNLMALEITSKKNSVFKSLLKENPQQDMKNGF